MPWSEDMGGNAGFLSQCVRKKHLSGVIFINPITAKEDPMKIQNLNWRLFFIIFLAALFFMPGLSSAKKPLQKIVEDAVESCNRLVMKRMDKCQEKFDRNHDVDAYGQCGDRALEKLDDCWEPDGFETTNRDHIKILRRAEKGFDRCDKEHLSCRKRCYKAYKRGRFQEHKVYTDCQEGCEKTGLKCWENVMKSNRVPEEED